MRASPDQYVVSTELECQTWLEGKENPAATMEAVSRFFDQFPHVIPCLPGEGGYFTPYGRVYPDCGHVELAVIECDSPYLLPSILERFQLVCREVIDGLEGPGGRLRLANNNHSGLLDRSAPTWGSHENYLVEQQPRQFTDLVLPFLGTRFYGGSGGIQARSGNFIASVRAEFIHHQTGGSTTEARALHSTCRNENHMGSRPGRYRYHLILGDGKRCHFNIALQFGATALALKAICYDDGYLREELRRLDHAPPDGSWVTGLHEMNVLAHPGREIAVDQRALSIQRTYWKAAERFVESHASPGWVKDILGNWQMTLDAAEQGNLPWLASRLDAFAKYQLFSARLAAGGHEWTDLLHDETLLCDLALVDHEWHEFTNPASCFEKAERAGLLDHRVGERIGPGEEEVPYVPEVTTRARPRAEFIIRNKGTRGMMVDWSMVIDHQKCRMRTMRDPFAKRFAPWKNADPAVRPEFLDRVLRRRRQRTDG